MTFDNATDLEIATEFFRRLAFSDATEDNANRVVELLDLLAEAAAAVDEPISDSEERDLDQLVTQLRGMKKRIWKFHKDGTSRRGGGGRA